MILLGVSLPPLHTTGFTFILFMLFEKSHFLHVHVLPRLKKIQEKKKIIKKKAEEAKKAKGITNGKSQ